MFKWVAEFGFDVQEMSYEEWRQMLVSLGEQGKDNAMYALLPLLSEVNDDDSARMPEFDCSNLTEMMSECGIACPPMDQPQLNIFLTYFVKSGFLEPVGSQHGDQVQPDGQEVDLNEDQMFD
eukprot:TRINITY_DN8544_c0_g1_i1.p1 TRINITY_DN8544_c0_g1~~TRINITY_DN8544_c0_g1_i1.p1  ORF type:complete len:122 (-),score=30.56 TRINITY_DN8544_c0_g1_i1:197-562(-)